MQTAQAAGLGLARCCLRYELNCERNSHMEKWSAILMSAALLLTTHIPVFALPPVPDPSSTNTTTTTDPPNSAMSSTTTKTDPLNPVTIPTPTPDPASSTTSDPGKEVTPVMTFDPNFNDGLNVPT